MDRSNPAEADSGPVTDNAPPSQLDPSSRSSYVLVLKCEKLSSIEKEFAGRKYFPSSSVDGRLILIIAQHLQRKLSSMTR